MGLINKQEKPKTSFKNPIDLDQKEIQFILDKLQTAQFIGKEFEMFYNVWVKLNNLKEK